MTNSKESGIDPFRTGKAYTVGEASRLARTTAATVRRWILGYDAPGHHMEPVFGSKGSRDSQQALQVSFLELVEVIVASRFRADDRITLERIRRAHGFARKHWSIAFPFASMNFKAFGGHLMHQFEDEVPGPGHMAFDLEGQWALPGLIQEALESVEFESDDTFAARWYPFGRQAHVVVDPHYAAGTPIVEGTRIPIRIIRERFQAGDSIRHLAADFSLRSSIVEAAIRLAA
jgi:uncharacterized protein (DUF433 family)